MSKRQITALFTVAALIAVTAAGCGHCRKSRNYCAAAGYYPAPLGTLSDPVWQQQESNAEASDFVVYEHEWTGNTTDLNDLGKTHVKQIAARALMVPFPILVQQSSMTARPDTRYQFPVHNNEELDMQRRQLVVQALITMGVQDAEERVVVSPALTPGFESFEAERAYGIGFSGGGWGGWGGGGGGGGGFGGGFGFF
jgi:uncharacterized membrane protein YgcG